MLRWLRGIPPDVMARTRMVKDGTRALNEWDRAEDAIRGGARCPLRAFCERTSNSALETTRSTYDGNSPRFTGRPAREESRRFARNGRHASPACAASTRH